METISVILPVYNGESYLENAITCLLAQKDVLTEIVIINDGSTDKTGEILEKLTKVNGALKIYHHHKNRGLGYTIKEGIEKSNGAIIARQDVDDVSLPYRLKRQLDFLNKNRDIVVCGTWANIIDNNHNVIMRYCPPNNSLLLKKMLKSKCNPLIHGSVMFRRCDYNKIEGGMKTLKLGEDYDLWNSFAKIGEIGCLESIEYLYRVNPEGVMSKKVAVSKKVKGAILKKTKNNDPFMLTNIVNTIINDSYSGNYDLRYNHTMKIACLLTKEFSRCRMKSECKHKIEGKGIKTKILKIIWKYKGIAKIYYMIKCRNNAVRYYKINNPMCCERHKGE